MAFYAALCCLTVLQQALQWPSNKAMTGISALLSQMARARMSCTSASIWVSFAASADTAVHNAFSSALQVPAPAMVQEEVEDATPAHASDPAAATLSRTRSDEEDGMAAADVTSHDGSFEVEVQVESSGDEEDSASGAVQENVQSARDMPGKVEVHSESGDDEVDDNLASGAVNVDIHPAGVNDEPKQEGVTTVNIAEASSDGDELRNGGRDSDDDDGDGMIPVNVHTSLLG